MGVVQTGKPVLQRYGKKFKLEDDLIFADTEGTIWMVPKGFETDLASIPSFIFWWHWGCWNWAAILHDYGYVHHKLIRINGGSPEDIEINRKFCDRLFYQNCLHLGVSKIESWLMYRAVHWFGRFFW